MVFLDAVEELARVLITAPRGGESVQIAIWHRHERTPRSRSSRMPPAPGSRPWHKNSKLPGSTTSTSSGTCAPSWQSPGSGCRVAAHLSRARPGPTMSTPVPRARRMRAFRFPHGWGGKPQTRSRCLSGAERWSARALTRVPLLLNHGSVKDCRVARSEREGWVMPGGAAGFPTAAAWRQGGLDSDDFGL